MGPDDREPVLSTVSSDEDDEESEFGQDTDDEDDEEKWRVANLLAQLGLENGDEENVMPVQSIPVSIQQPPSLGAPLLLGALPPLAPPHTRPFDHPQLQVDELADLRDALHTRFQAAATETNHEDINRAIALNEKAVKILPADAPDMAGVLASLGNALQTRYQGQHQASTFDMAYGAPPPSPQPYSTPALNGPAEPTLDRPMPVQQWGSPFQLPHLSNYPQLQQLLHQGPQTALSPQAVDRRSIFGLIGVLVLTHFVTYLVAKSVYVEGILISIFIAIGVGIGLIFMRSLHVATKFATGQNHPVAQVDHDDSTRKRDADDLRQDNRGQNDSIFADPPEKIPREAPSTEDQTKAQITANVLPFKVPGKSPNLFQHSRQMKARGNIIIITVPGVRYNS
jgi:hypothetical protein